MSEPPPVTTRREGSIAVITLDRPAARNAVNLPLCVALTEAFDAAHRDDEVHAVLLNGAGPSFCAGADLKERNGRDAAWVRRRREASFEAYRAIARCSKPVLALVHGSVVGSGGEIAMSADFIYAAHNTVFRFPEVHWGTIGATQRLQRAIGIRKAKELLFTGGDLAVQNAYELRLVQRVLPLDSALEESFQTVRRMAQAPLRSARLTKAAMDQGSELTMEQGIATELWAIDQNLAAGVPQGNTDDYA